MSPHPHQEDADRKIAALDTVLAAHEEKLRPSRDKMAHLHKRHREFEALCRDHGRAAAAGVLTDAAIAHKDREILRQHSESIRGAETAVLDDEEQVAGIKRQRLALERFRDLVAPHDIEHVHNAKAHAWDWPDQKPPEVQK